MAEQVEIETGV